MEARSLSLCGFSFGLVFHESLEKHLKGLKIADYITKDIKNKHIHGHLSSFEPGR